MKGNMVFHKQHETCENTSSIIIFIVCMLFKCTLTLKKDTCAQNLKFYQLKPSSVDHLPFLGASTTPVTTWWWWLSRPILAWCSSWCLCSRRGSWCRPILGGFRCPVFCGLVGSSLDGNAGNRYRLCCPLCAKQVLKRLVCKLEYTFFLNI